MHIRHVKDGRKWKCVEGTSARSSVVSEATLSACFGQPRGSSSTPAVLHHGPGPGTTCRECGAGAEGLGQLEADMTSYVARAEWGTSMATADAKSHSKTSAGFKVQVIASHLDVLLGEMSV